MMDPDRLEIFLERELPEPSDFCTRLHAQLDDSTIDDVLTVLVQIRAVRNSLMGNDDAVIAMSMLETWCDGLDVTFRPTPRPGAPSGKRLRRIS
jgi:hypothetical protein